MLLTGGFSTSPFVQAYLCQALQRRRSLVGKVFASYQPQLDVMQGAPCSAVPAVLSA